MLVPWGAVVQSGGGGVSEEVSGIELLLSEPEIVAWLEPEEIGEGDGDAVSAESGLHTRAVEVLDPRASTC